MKRAVFISLALGLARPAFAQEPPAESAPEEADLDTLEGLEQTLQELKQRASANEERIQTVESLLQSAIELGDRRNDIEVRVRAAAKLAEIGDEYGMQLLWIGATDDESGVREAVYKAAASFPGESSLAMARLALATEDQVASAEAAAGILINNGSNEAAEVLFEAAGAKGANSVARDAAQAALESHFSEFLAERGPPAVVSDEVGSSLFALANGVLGGFSLSTVGAFGQSDAALVIGGIGGTVIGAGGGLGYAASNPVSRGQGLAYLSTSTWGLIGGHMLSDVLWGEQRDSDEFRLGMVARTLGGLGGAYAGWKAMEHQPDISDVLEVNLSTYLGMHSFIGLVDVINSEPRSYGGYDYVGDCYNDDGYYNDYLESSEVDCGGVSWQEIGQWRERRYRIERAAGLAGGALGAALGYRLREVWQPSGWDVVYAAIAGTEGALLGVTVPAAVGAGERDGATRLGFHLAAAGGLAYAHYRPMTEGQVFMAGWGALMSNALGWGLGYAAEANYQNQNRLVAPIGLAGLVGGTILGTDYELTANDRSLIGVGTGLGSWNAIMFSAWANEVELGGPDWDGVSLLGFGLSGLASAAASKWVEVDAEYSAFVGTSAAWGAFYAVTGMLASGAEGETSTAIATTLVASDILAGLAAWAGSDKGFIDPSLVGTTTLTGLTGATLGSLSVLMASDDSQAVSIGALAGATVGLGVGAAFASKIKEAVTDSVGTVRLPDLPGKWTLSLAPSVMENGDLGAHLGVQAFGF